MTIEERAAHGRQDTRAGGGRRGPHRRRGLAAALIAAALGLGAALPAAAVDCSCDEIREYLKTVEKKEECYKKAYETGRKTPWNSLAAVNSSIESCMGWVSGSAVSEGKPGTASAEEQEAAQDACKAAHCDWICRESIRAVHEKYHEWYDAHERMMLAVLIFRGLTGSGTQAMQQENILGEIGAHDAEAEFLRDRIAAAERKGECSNVRGSVSQAERDRRIKEAQERVKKYLESLEGKP